MPELSIGQTLLLLDLPGTAEDEELVLDDSGNLLLLEDPDVGAIIGDPIPTSLGLEGYDTAELYADPARARLLRVRLDDPQPRMVLGKVPPSAERYLATRVVGVDASGLPLPITVEAPGVPNGVLVEWDIDTGGWYVVIDQTVITRPFGLTLTLATLPTSSAGSRTRTGTAWFTAS